MDSNIARILSKARTSGHKSDSENSVEHSNEGAIIPQNIIENLSGPALLTDSSLNILEKNIYADNLVSAFQNRHPIVHGIIIRCLTNGCPENQKITLEDESGARHYDLFAFPVKAKGKDNSQILLFGKDTTAEQHLTNALVQSRQMFKDLVACSTDFAWETDNKGRFKYVSPNGILGYTAYELNDKRAANLIVGQDGLNPFDTLDAIHDVEIWLQRSDGAFACVQVSANPIIDNNSTWQGARGVCRDVTEMREREASLRRVMKSEQVLKKIISTIRDEVDPSKILHTTATAALDGISAKQSYIVSIEKNDDADIKLELKAQCTENSDSALIETLSKRAMSICKNSQETLPTAYMEELIDGQQVLIGFSKHHNKINGVMFIVIDDETKTWNKEEKSLFMGIVNHLGIAFEQIKNYETLERLSNTDELTSLFNRRAFSEKVNKRLTIQNRTKQTCALLFTDLDNFKQINDVYGHATGDAVLKKLSKLLQKNTRTADFCSRLGGDEFAVWLENVDEKSAARQAKRILDGVNELKEIADNKDKPLSLSIGIALSEPASIQNLDCLMEQADKALYTVKNNGKSGVSLYQSENFK
ncbi:MAG: diguanylate cyclase [Emcibacteraceae bacterium]|nr:diguanylate cyclase [Emcibacteraceae bacterium]